MKRWKGTRTEGSSACGYRRDRILWLKKEILLLLVVVGSSNSSSIAAKKIKKLKVSAIKEGNLSNHVRIQTYLNQWTSKEQQELMM